MNNRRSKKNKLDFTRTVFWLSIRIADGFYHSFNEKNQTTVPSFIKSKSFPLCWNIVCNQVEFFRNKESYWIICFWTSSWLLIYILSSYLLTFPTKQLTLNSSIMMGFRLFLVFPFPLFFYVFLYLSLSFFSLSFHCSEFPIFSPLFSVFFLLLFIFSAFSPLLSQH